MSRFYPHPPYAEDQPFRHTILTTHVLTRGFQSGALVGCLVAVPVYCFRKPNHTPSASASTSTIVPRSFPLTLLRSAGSGTLIGTSLLGIALAARMRDKEPIEWADRSWRLLENKGQVELDDWSLGGAVLGAAATYFSGLNRAGLLGWRGILGGTGVGSLIGVAGCMVWRRGIKGGKWEDDKSLEA